MEEYLVTNIKFSIIVPVFNIENYLRQCINSLIMQTYKNIEILLVDDGSADGSLEICKEAARQDDRVVVLRKDNGGSTSARKEGTKIATGDYITCVDGDDYVSNDYIKYFADIVSKFEPDIILCGTYRFSDHSLEKIDQQMQEGLYLREDIEKKIFPYLLADEQGNTFSSSIWAKAYKRQLFVAQQMAVDNLIKMGDDFACTRPCIANARTIYIGNKPNYYYRFNPLSMTKRREALEWDNPRIRAEHLCRQIDMEKYDFKDQLYRTTVHSLFNVAVSQFNTDKKYIKIVKEISVNLKSDFYKECMKKCKFKFMSKGFFAHLILKFRMFPIMRLYNRYHQKN